MEQITIRVRDKEKAQLLLQLLRSLDFVEQIATADADSATLAEKERGGDADSKTAFFELAGLWEGRDVSQESLRQAAWPRQSS